MNRETMKYKLLAMMKEKFRLHDVEQLEDAMRLHEDLRLDSIMMVQLIVYIELDLRLQVPDDEVDPRAFSTVATLLDFMETLKPLDAALVYET